MMHTRTLAVPSMAPGGLDASRSGHFGRCDAFTLVDVRAGEVVSTRVVDNVEHTTGGCLVPVDLLHREGTHALVVAGIGAGPLQGFRRVGIDVLVGPGETVAEVVAAHLRGATCGIAENAVCGNHGHE